MVFKIIGAALLLWGIADFAISYQGGNLWTQVGVSLPSEIASYSHFAAMGLGVIIFLVFGIKRTPPRI